MTYTDGVATLEISPSEPSDANEYRVEAKNKMGEVSSKATLTVNGNYVLSAISVTRFIIKVTIRITFFYDPSLERLYHCSKTDNHL